MEFGAYGPGLNVSLTAYVVLSKSLEVQCLSLLVSKIGIPQNYIAGYKRIKKKANILLQ